MQSRASSMIVLSFLLLSACGGATSGGLASAPITPPTPTPTPTPTPATPLAIFQPPPSTSVTYTTVGYGHGGTTTAISGSGLTLAYDAATNSYLASYGPGTPSVTIGADSQADNARFLGVAGGGAIYRPGSANPELNLTYSSLFVHPMAGPWDYGGGEFVAFGTATPASNIPVTGNASYNAVAYGQTLSTNYDVRGNVRLNFDFAAGALSGYFDSLLISYDGINTALARQTFANTVFGRGSQSFSGSFAGIAGSSFNGQFTGPGAEELIGRFTQPFGANETIVGAWVGKR